MRTIAIATSAAWFRLGFFPMLVFCFTILSAVVSALPLPGDDGLRFLPAEGASSSTSSPDAPNPSIMTWFHVNINNSSTSTPHPNSIDSKKEQLFLVHDSVDQNQDQIQENVDAEPDADDAAALGSPSSSSSTGPTPRPSSSNTQSSSTIKLINPEEDYPHTRTTTTSTAIKNQEIRLMQQSNIKKFIQVQRPIIEPEEEPHEEEAEKVAVTEDVASGEDEEEQVAESTRNSQHAIKQQSHPPAPAPGPGPANPAPVFVHRLQPTGLWLPESPRLLVSTMPATRTEELSRDQGHQGQAPIGLMVNVPPPPGPGPPSPPPFTPELRQPPQAMPSPFFTPYSSSYTNVGPLSLLDEFHRGTSYF